MESLFEFLNGVSRWMKPDGLLPKGIDLGPVRIHSFASFFFENFAAMLAHYWIFSVVFACLLVATILVFGFPMFFSCDAGDEARVAEVGIGKIKKWILTALRWVFLVWTGLAFSTAAFADVRMEEGISEMPTAYTAMRNEQNNFLTNVYQELETKLLGTYPSFQERIINLFLESDEKVIDQLRGIDRSISLQHLQKMESVFREGERAARKMGMSFKKLNLKKEEFKESLQRWKADTGKVLDECIHPECTALKHKIVKRPDIEFNLAELPKFFFMIAKTINLFFTAVYEIVGTWETFRELNIPEALHFRVMKEKQNTTRILEGAEEILVKLIRDMGTNFSEEVFIKWSSQDPLIGSNLQELLDPHILKFFGRGIICGMAIIIVICLTVELLNCPTRLSSIGPMSSRVLKCFMAATNVVLICIAGIVGVILIMGDTCYCDLLNKLGTDGSQGQMVDAIFPRQTGTILRGFSMNDTLAHVLGIEPNIFKASAFINYNTCEKIAFNINEAASRVKLFEIKLLYWTPKTVEKLHIFIQEDSLWETNITTRLIAAKVNVSVLDSDMAETTTNLYETANLLEHQTERGREIAKKLRECAAKLNALRNQHVIPLLEDLKNFKFPSMDVIFGRNRTVLKKEIHRLIEEAEGVILFQDEEPTLIEQIAPKFKQKCKQVEEKHVAHLEETAIEVGRSAPLHDTFNANIGFICHQVISPGNGLWLCIPFFVLGLLGYLLAFMLAPQNRHISSLANDQQEPAGVMNQGMELEDVHNNEDHNSD